MATSDGTVCRPLGFSDVFVTVDDGSRGGPATVSTAGADTVNTNLRRREALVGLFLALWTTVFVVLAA